MKNLKKNWLPIVVVASLAVILAAGVWYVNGVYIPNKKEALANEVLGENNAQIGQNTQDGQQSEESTYDYTIDPDELVTIDIGEVLGNESNVTITTDENGDVWIDRDWVVDTTDYDKGDIEPGEEIAAGNMTSGQISEDITDEDGVYHGEQPSGSSTGNGGSSSSGNGGNGSGSSGSTPNGGSGNDADSSNQNPDSPNNDTPSSGKDGPTGSDTPSDNSDSSGTSPSGDDPSSNPENNNSEDDPASGSDDPNGTDPDGGSNNGGNSGNGGSSSSGGGSSSSSEPKSGDIRVVDGQEQIYINGIGWIDWYGGGGEGIPIEGNGFIGEPCPNANFG